MKQKNKEVKGNNLLTEINDKLDLLANKKRIITGKQLEEKYEISRTTRWRWEKEGIITRVQKIGRKIFYLDPEETFLAA